MPAPSSLESLSTTYADNYPAGTDTFDPSALDDTLRVHAGSIARLRDTARDIGVSIEDLRYGGVADDSTNNITPLVNAMAANSTIYFGAGTYRFTVTSGVANGVNISTTARIIGQGAGKTILKFVLSGTTTTTLFKPDASGQLYIEGCTIEIVNPDGADVGFFGGAGINDLTAVGCEFDGSVTDNGVTFSNAAYLIIVPSSGTHEHIKFIDCYSHHLTAGILKTNASTSTQNDVQFVRCRFDNFYKTALQFNTPNGVVSDVLIDGCRFTDHAGAAIGLTDEVFHVSCSGSNLRLVNNYFGGEVVQAFHSEEGARNTVVANNVFEVDGIGIALLDNDVGGSDDSPADFVIANNVFIKTGTAKSSGSHAIWLVHDDGAVVYTPGKRILVTANTIWGFEYGITSDARSADGCYINGNIATNCTYGFRQFKNTASFSGNRSTDCDYAVMADSGGVFRSHGVINCTNLVSDGGRRVVLVDPYFEWDTASVDALSTTHYSVLTLNSSARFSGSLSAYAVTSTTADTDFTTDVVKWDGTTLTINDGAWDGINSSYSGGAILLSTVNNSGVMAIRLYSASARTNVRVSAHVNGSILAAA